MPKALCPEDEFISLFETHGGVEAARIIGCAPANVYARKKRIERDRGKLIRSPTVAAKIRQSEYVSQRYHVDLDDGIIVVFSDAHYWPGIVSTAHRALLRFLELYGHDIKVVVNNGDALDGAGISRHPPNGWEQTPSVRQEIDACKERLGEIVERSGGKLHIWNMGNHDSRFEARLAQYCPEFVHVEGFDLGSHFPDWQFAMSTRVNEDLVLKHRFKGGIHATHNNAMWAGRSVCTGHLHSLKVTPFTDYNGTRWGIDTGTLAEPEGPQFAYGEDSPRNWRAGFAVLSIREGRLIDAELTRVMEPGRVVFRGKVHEV